MFRGGDYNFSANPLGNNISVEYKSRYEWLFWHGI